MMQILHYSFLSFIIIIFNLPFGYWRQGTRKFSFHWFLYIHLPVPFVVWMRHLFHVRLSLAIAPLLFGSYFLGQFIGKKIREARRI
jgi:hypothetical protein